jgi:putative peptidoglycan lipid II flippase
MITHVLATASQFLMYIYGLKKVGFKYQWKFEVKDEYVLKILHLIPPVLVSVGISDINKIIDKSMGSTLIVGSISSLNYADRLSALINGIFILAITTVMYPMFSKEASSGNHRGLKKSMINGINIILLITIPATVGMIVLAYPIVKLAYERGLFDSVATMMTAGALIYSSMRMMSSGINTLLRNVYYSIQDTKTPVLIGAVAVIVNITFNLLLIKSMGHLGLALATTISSIVTSFILLITLRKKIGRFGFSSSIKVAIKASLATLVMGIIVYFLHGYLINYLAATRLMEAVALASSVLVGMFVYFILIILFKIEEVKWLLGFVKSRFKNR